MKRTAVLLSTAAALLASNAFAMGPNDRVMTANDMAVAYLDPASVKTRKGRLTAWVVTDYRTVDAKLGNSVREMLAVDCANEEVGSLMLVGYSLPGGRGSVTVTVRNETPEMAPVIPGSVHGHTLRAICAFSRGESPDLATYDRIQGLRGSGEHKGEWWLQDKYHPAQ